MAVYIVTGGAGFIGSNLSEQLIKDGHSVHIVDNLSAGKKENIPKGAKLHVLDIREREQLSKLFKEIQPDGIFHLAALPRVQYSIENPAETHEVNVTGTLNVLLAAKDCGNAKVVFAASSSAYGDTTELPTDERTSINPKSPYALHKVVGEQYCRLFSTVYNVPTLCLRYFNVYGPKCDPNGAYALVIGRFIQMRIEGKPMTITGDGTQTRDAVHVDDVARANILAMTNDAVHAGEIFNIGSGESRSVNELAEMIGGPVEHIEPRLEPHDTLADISKAEKLLGWKPAKEFSDGLRELMEEMGLE